MAADAWVVHDKFIEYMGDGTVDLDNDTFILILCTSASNIATTSINALSTVTNEVSGNGYARYTLTGVTWNEAAGVVTFNCNDMVDAITAAGGNIVARFAAIFDDTVTSPVADPIVAHTLLDNTPADITITDGNTLTINTPAGGIFQSQRG